MLSAVTLSASLLMDGAVEGELIQFDTQPEPGSAAKAGSHTLEGFSGGSPPAP